MHDLISLFEKGSFDKCLNALDKIERMLTEQETRLKAECFHRLKRYEDAMNTWNLAIANFGEQADFYSERAVCKFHLRFKSSMEDLNRAVELDPENGYRYACRAYVRDKLGDTEGAIEDYKTANELDPENEITLNNLGLAEEKLGHTQRSRQLFQQADEIAGVSHITSKYFETSTEDETIEEEKPTIRSEIKKMVSSGSEFKAFWQDALRLLRLKK